VQKAKPLRCLTPPCDNALVPTPRYVITYADRFRPNRLDCFGFSLIPSLLYLRYNRDIGSKDTLTLIQIPKILRALRRLYWLILSCPKRFQGSLGEFLRRSRLFLCRLLDRFGLDGLALSSDDPK
jgi:hypothetical protein